MPVPKITPSEWEVMRLLWRRSPQTAAEVIENVPPSTEWTPKTIRTLFTRLVKKGAIGYEQRGRIYHYYPLVEEKDCAAAETKSFLERVYGGALEPMIANFLDAEQLSDAEIDSLKAIIDSKGSND